jgi:site-specific DNA-cytosine methylase
MDWPDDWTRWTDDGQEVPDSARYKMCGNGVVPAVAKWVGLQIQAAQSDLF